MGRPRGVVALVVALALALAGCTATERPDDGASPSSDGTGTAAPTPTAEAEVAVRPQDAEQVRELGEPLGVGSLVVALLAPEATPSQPADGVRELTFRYAPAVLEAITEPALLAPAEGGSFEVLGDGSVLVRDGAGKAVAGMSPPESTAGHVRWAALDPDLLALELSGPAAGATPATDAPDDAPDVEVTASVADVALESATWGDREGGRSLAVVPTPWARAAGEAGYRLLEEQLLAAEPEADSTTMRDQLLCHSIGAPDKDAWNLEPWRPDVGLLGVLAAACNPT